MSDTDKILDAVTAVKAAIESLDAKVSKLLAALDRLEGPLTIDADPEIDGHTIH